MPSQINQRLKDLNHEKRVQQSSTIPADELDRLYKNALDFYQGAKARDAQMIQNVQRILKEKGQSKAVVVTGGFHAGPFANYFQNQGFNYALITPKISEIESRELYVKSILQYQAKDADNSTFESIPFGATLPVE